MVFVTEKIVLTTENIFSVNEKMVSVVEKMVSEPETVFSKAETIFSEPETIFSKAETVVEDIVPYVGRTGSLTPVAHLRPAKVAGVPVDPSTQLVTGLCIAGLIVALYYGSFDFTLGWTFGLKAFIAAILGGIGNIAGAMLGGLLLGVVETLASGYISPQWKDVIAYVVLIVILIGAIVLFYALIPLLRSLGHLSLR